MILNITYQGTSADHEVEGLDHLTDDDIRMVATEVAKLPPNSLNLYVVDRFGTTVYVRPKVPFGAL